MEKIKAKVEQVLHKDKDTTTHGTTGTHTGTHTGTTGTHVSDPSGPHNSHAANKVDPRVDSDLPGAAGNTAGASHTTGHGTTGLGSSTTHGTTGLGSSTHGTHGTTGLGSNTTSTHGTTGLGSNTHGTHGTTGLGSGTHGTHGTTGLGSNTHSDPSGPHDSKLANKLDPRVDSDQPGNLGNSGGARTGGTGIGHSTGHTTGHTTGHGGLTSGTTGAYGSDPSGPHDSRLANSADPRVDHDRDGSRTVGNTGTGYSGTHTGTHTGAGLTGGSHTGAGLTGGSHTGTYGSDPSGPHDSRFANSADPRVDHDRDGSRTVGNTGAGYSGTTTGTHTGAGLTGGHNTHGTHGTTGATSYSGNTVGGHLPGPADKTAGPHKSDLLNKVDPRVDSDVDGSKTVGNQPTYR